MAHYQYAHLETFARKRHGKKRMHRFTIVTILYEMMRRKNYCAHVLNPRAPNILFGTPWKVLFAVARWYRLTRDSRGRRLQATTNAMVGAVFSFQREHYEADPEAYQNWVAKVTAWLKEKYGERLRMLVEHLDESHPHLHVLLVPMPGEPIATVHPGAAVWAERGLKRQHRGQGRRPLEQQGFLSWQDEYFAKVAQFFGMARSKEPGEKGVHLPRREYNARQRALQEAQQAKTAPIVSQNIVDPTPVAAKASPEREAENPVSATPPVQPDAPVTLTGNSAAKKRDESVDYVLCLLQRAQTLQESAGTSNGLRPEVP